MLDTHVHADHLSRSRQLAVETGAVLYLPETNRVAYPFAPVSDGDTFQIGDSSVRAMHTPGHTPESTTYVLDDAALFTGDTLFLSGVGRPDLDANVEQARERAHQLYNSLHRLLSLPPATQILPGHTSQPIAFDAVAVTASLEEVRQRLVMLDLSENDFVETILTRIPATPPNLATIVAFNEAGELPVGDPTDLEAGANRCAVT